MGKEMTAVEWYANRLCDIEIAYNQGVIDTEVYVKSKTHAYEQAKEMEKEQIMDAYYNGTTDEIRTKEEILFEAEHFYQETYRGNK